MRAENYNKGANIEVKIEIQYIGEFILSKKT